METKFSARQRLLGMSECERLCGKTSRVIEDFAFRSGTPVVPGQPFNVPVQSALNILVYSIAMDGGAELGAVAAWLPGLRNEALLKLGEDISNWSFEGPSDMSKHFWPAFYGDRDTIRPEIARMLRCCMYTTTRQLRYHSQRQVELLSNTQFELRQWSSSPRFTIDAHELADTLVQVCEARLFTARPEGFV